MKQRWLLPGWQAAMLVLSPAGNAQSGGYPITVLPPGKSATQFPPGLRNAVGQDPNASYGEDSGNIYILHGSEGLDP